MWNKIKSLFRAVFVRVGAVTYTICKGIVTVCMFYINWHDGSSVHLVEDPIPLMVEPREPWETPLLTEESAHMRLKIIESFMTEKILRSDVGNYEPGGWFNTKLIAELHRIPLEFRKTFNTSVKPEFFQTCPSSNNKQNHLFDIYPCLDVTQQPMNGSSWYMNHFLSEIPLSIRTRHIEFFIGQSRGFLWDVPIKARTRSLCIEALKNKVGSLHDVPPEIKKKEDFIAVCLSEGVKFE